MSIPHPPLCRINPASESIAEARFLSLRDYMVKATGVFTVSLLIGVLLNAKVRGRTLRLLADTEGAEDGCKDLVRCDVLAQKPLHRFAGFTEKIREDICRSRRG